ncbi:hypothetical protein HW115_08260 [Verrucomicrobiaceae bacterium N1E253]|uniref:Uncharacterized protein n=1 Tax=Oceaniferula marina TaxID=2748318 RepID=A0A851GFC1_9BACT|nr:hypothetical protein [Oceaniferula marina]NWK55602.1 hypothetical protein [Oceaniferula marina]
MKAKISHSVCLVPLLFLFIAPISAAPPDPQKDLHLQVFKDTASGVAIQYVKDSLGNIYQLKPAGPKLSWGVSNQVIAAQGKKYGYRMVPASWANGAVEAQHATQSVKDRVSKIVKADKTAMKLTSIWEIKKMGDVIYVAYTGEGKASEAQYQVIGATISAELGLGASYIGGQIGVGAIGGFGVGLLATWTGNNVQQAIEDGLSAWDAKLEANQTVKNWKANEVRLANELLHKIHKAVTKGDYERARELNKGLYDFTRKRQGAGDPAIADLNALSYDLQTKISQAEKAKKKAIAEARSLGEKKHLARIHQFNEEIKRRREKEAKEKAEFDVRLIIATPHIQLGQQGEAGFTITGGTPPYDVQGDFYGPLQKPQTITFAFDTPKEPGAYGLAVRVTDADGRIRNAYGSIWMSENPKNQEPLAAVGKVYPTMVKNGSAEVHLNLSGFRVTSVWRSDKGKGGTLHGSQLHLEGVFTEDRLSVKGVCQGEGRFGKSSVVICPDGTPQSRIYWEDYKHQTADSFKKSFDRSFPVSKVEGKYMMLYIMCHSGHDRSKSIEVRLRLDVTPPGKKKNESDLNR